MWEICFLLTEEKDALNMACGDNIEIYIKIFISKSKLLIVGGGYISIVTRGRIHDEIALRAVINSKVKYGGMIEIKNKVAKLKKLLKDNYDINKINFIYTPIGIDLGGESPQK